MASITGTPASNTLLLRSLRDLQKQTRDFDDFTSDASERISQILGEAMKIPLAYGDRIQ